MVARLGRRGRPLEEALGLTGKIYYPTINTISAMKKSKTLAEQIAELKDPTPKGAPYIILLRVAPADRK